MSEEQVSYDTSGQSTNNQDISQRARSIARMLDRLESGSYCLEIIKPPEKGRPWSYNLTQPVTIRKGTLPKEDTPQN